VRGTESPEGQTSARARYGIALLAVLLLFAVVAAGCGDDDDEGSGGGGGGSGEARASEEDVMAFQPGTEQTNGVNPEDIDVQPVEGGCRIAVLMAYNIEFFNNMAYGAQQEAERLGCETTIQAATGYGDTTNQLQQFDTALAQEPDAMIVHAADEKAIAPAVDRAWAAGIPVSYASVKGPSEKVMAILTDDLLAGRQQGEYIGKQDPNAEVIAMCGPPGIEWAKLRCQGLKEGLAEAAPDAKVVAEKYHEMERGEVGNVAGNTIEAFPNAKYIYNSTDLQATGVVDALRNKRLDPGEKVVTTLTIGRETEKLMREGWIQYAVTERPVLFGKLAVDLVVSVLNGDTADLEQSAILAPAQPAYEGPEGAEEFCGGDCSDITQGEVQWNWGPEDFEF
jgi:ribose transport system substrate-binding protein